MGESSTAAFWRTGNINHNEVAGAFSRVFEGIFMEASTRVATDCVSMSKGGVEVAVQVDDDEWTGTIVVAGTGELEDFTCEGFEDFDEVVNWLTIARHLWDTELRPVDGAWHDEGGLITAAGGDFGKVAEQWAYRTVRIPMTVYYSDPDGWGVGFGRSPREAADRPLHGPFKHMNHAKLYVEAWTALDTDWTFAGKDAFGDWKPTDLCGRAGGFCKQVEGGWSCDNDEPSESPLDAILMCEQRIRDRQAATKIGDPAR